MPNEGNQGKDSDCPVNATADGTLANPGVDPEFCDKVGRQLPPLPAVVRIDDTEWPQKLGQL